jgi:uncharacterized protein YvpB
MRRILFILFFLFCFYSFTTSVTAQSSKQRQQSPTPFQAQRQQTKQKLKKMSEESLEQAKQAGFQTQDFFKQSQEDQKKREQLQDDLTQGKSVDTSMKSARMQLPFVSKQRDGWSCGLHTATRLLKYRQYDINYETLKTQRKITALWLESDQGPYTLPHALEKILRYSHSDSWWMTNVKFDVIRNLLRQKKPVAALIAMKGNTFKVKLGDKRLEVPATHWVAVSGFDDARKIIYYYDPLKEGEQQESYDKFLEVWDTQAEDYVGKNYDPLLLTYGFIASRTIGFCN